MEQELGIQLLFRNTKTVTLTAAGKVFAQECSRILETWNTAIERARNAQYGIIGTIKLGIQRSTFEPFIVDLIRKFKKEHPNIGVNLRAMSITDLLDGLTVSGLDFIIAEGTPSL